MEEFAGAVLALAIIWLTDKLFGAKAVLYAVIIIIAGSIILGGMDFFDGKNFIKFLQGK